MRIASVTMRDGQIISDERRRDPSTTAEPQSGSERSCRSLSEPCTVSARACRSAFLGVRVDDHGRGGIQALRATRCARR